MGSTGECVVREVGGLSYSTLLATEFSEEGPLEGTLFGGSRFKLYLEEVEDLLAAVFIRHFILRRIRWSN